MISKSEDKQFKLADDGQVLWQADATNPLPGVPVGRIRKGEQLLKPVVDVVDGQLPDGEDKATIATKLQEWLERHIHFALEPLFRLTGGEDFTDASRTIATKLQDALGILPRADLEDVIAGLDEEGRKGLRARKVRMGPLLVFLPELNKPAAVKLRAMLLTLWQEKELPAQAPKDGVVSFTIADKNIDPDYYRSIGYPVYGPRSIRVDMLDRVVCAVYDGAKDGKFQAQHKMAEWLGSNILDLYAVLEAMGHKMIHDPAAEKAKDEEAASIPTPPLTPPPAGGQSEATGGSELVPAAGAEVKKPELATFRLKRGKADGAERPRESRAPKKEQKTFAGKDKKPFNERKKDDKKFSKKKSDRPKRDEREDREDRVYSSNPQKFEDSPFAVLQGLKLKK